MQVIAFTEDLAQSFIFWPESDNWLEEAEEISESTIRVYPLEEGLEILESLADMVRGEVIKKYLHTNKEV